MSAFQPWSTPHFKVKVAPKVRRALTTTRPRTAAENRNKQKVRERDRYCRFPACACFRFKLALHVSHQRHKGIGGNPKGDRSHPDKMILVCGARHRENRLSIDQGTIRWKQIGRDAKGHPLVAWSVDSRAIEYSNARSMVYKQKWIEVARETALHVFERFTPEQLAILERLATMEI